VRARRWVDRDQGRRHAAWLALAVNSAARVRELMRRDLRLVLDVVKLPDDPDWLAEPDPEFVEAARGD